MTQLPGDRAPLSAASLEREADALNKRLDDVLAAQSVGRWMLLIPVLLILGAFTLFAFNLVNTLRSNFNQQAVQSALTAQARDLAPQLQQRVGVAMQKALPVYRDTLMERVREAGPVIAEQALERFKTVPKENADILIAELQGMVDRVALQVEPEIKRQFPGLDETQMAQLLTEFKEGQVTEQTERLRNHVGEAVANELMSVDQVLTKFEVKGSDLEDIEALKRGFVVNLLDYAKYLVEYGGTEGGDIRQVLIPGVSRRVAPQPVAQ